jgi:23S rRNA pseudouridine2605 synthase
VVELIICEGKNHQVKKMFEAIGFKVLKLKRESIAFLTLDGVKPGEYRPLSIKEVKKLYGEKNNQD